MEGDETDAWTTLGREAKSVVDALSDSMITGSQPQSLEQKSTQPMRSSSEPQEGQERNMWAAKQVMLQAPPCRLIQPGDAESLGREAAKGVSNTGEVIDDQTAARAIA